MKKVWKYPDEVIGFVQEHGHEGSIRDMQQRLNELFGISLTYDQVKGMFSRYKAHAAPRKGRTYPEKRITTPEMDSFILAHYRGTGPSGMAELVNGAFGTCFTHEQMKSYYSRNKLDSGLDGRFVKGQEPPNKGKTWDEYMSPEAQERSRKTQFKKGHMPHNGGTPVGTLRIRHDHEDRGRRPYYWEKVAEPNVWRMKHVVEWERVNGPVPDGYVITFADGDSLNWQIGNLLLETRSQLAVRNHLGIRSYDRESAEIAQRIADLKMAVSARKKERRKRS